MGLLDSSVGSRLQRKDLDGQAVKKRALEEEKWRERGKSKAKVQGKAEGKGEGERGRGRGQGEDEDVTFGERRRQAKVPELQVPGNGHENVVRLNVSMYQVRSMQVAERRTQLAAPCHNDKLAETAAACTSLDPIQVL
jgi:hypothetical protein